MVTASGGDQKAILGSRFEIYLYHRARDVQGSRWIYLINLWAPRSANNRTQFDSADSAWIPPSVIRPVQAFQGPKHVRERVINQSLRGWVPVPHGHGAPITQS
ncbi:hypothetical protein V2G26_012520 [Clonostachys chloroleuca]